MAERLQVQLVAEAANGPTTRDGDRVLATRKIDVIPDIICNAGGVTVSYYEWLQNQRLEHWSEAEVNQRLERAHQDELRDHPRHRATTGRSGPRSTTRAGTASARRSTCGPPRWCSR